MGVHIHAHTSTSWSHRAINSAKNYINFWLLIAGVWKWVVLSQTFIWRLEPQPVALLEEVEDLLRSGSPLEEVGCWQVGLEQSSLNFSLAQMWETPAAMPTLPWYPSNSELKQSFLEFRDGSVIKSSYLFFKRPGFSSQYWHGSS